MKVAVVGGGVSGLAPAHELLLAASGGGDVRVTLYEQEESLGGRARTVAVDGGAGRVHLDLGFMSFNQDLLLSVKEEEDNGNKVEDDGEEEEGGD
ncbi:hypothetical protein TRIUR3_11280 [Triticum urartu]|uniref:Amine oxidase domain-containing protein n=1 Tax=Triticum urartu TaxID=4572 RepID=M7Z4R4_TRIUA|nr:hypothetical protein TRIUR3_11280 [Triticum urartu]